MPRWAEPQRHTVVVLCVCVCVCVSFAPVSLQWILRVEIENYRMK